MSVGSPMDRETVSPTKRLFHGAFPLLKDKVIVNEKMRCGNSAMKNLESYRAHARFGSIKKQTFKSLYLLSTLDYLSRKRDIPRATRASQ